MNQITTETNGGVENLHSNAIPASLRKFAMVVTGMLATTGSVSESTQAQEPPNPAGIVAPRDPGMTNEHDASLVTDYQKGFSQGFLAGKMSVLIDSVRKDMIDIGKTIEKNGTTEEKAEWNRQSGEVAQRLLKIEVSLAPEVAEKFDSEGALKDLQRDIQLVNSFALLARRMEQPASAQAGSPVAGNTDLRIVHGDIISLEIYNKLLKPFVDQLSVGEPGAVTDREGTPFGGLKLPRPIPGPNAEQLDGFHSLRDQMKRDLNSTVDKIKEKRARDAAAREAAAQKENDK